MAEFTFPCPACHRSIQCDDAWTGQQINCPLCNGLFTVPKSAPGGHNPLVPKPPGDSKLATAQSTNVARSSFGSGAPPIRQFTKVGKKNKKKEMIQYGVTVLVVIVLGVAGYMWGWPAYQKWKQGGDAGEIASGTANNSGTATNAAPDGQAAEPLSSTNLPIVVPVYTLAIAKAEIPKGRLNGTISGTNFVAESARLVRSATAAVLDLRQGTGQTPDRGVQISIRLAASETPTNKTFTVSTNERAADINNVTKLWKPNPRYAAQQKNYFNGYALKLEFGSQAEDGSIPGKIYLALPDPEKSVIGGAFTVSPPSTAQTFEAAPVQQQTPQDTEAQQRMQRRYGIRR